MPVEVAQVSSPIDIAGRYNQVTSNVDLEIVKKLRSSGIKK